LKRKKFQRQAQKFKTMLSNRNFSNLPVELYPKIFKYVAVMRDEDFEYSPNKIRNIRLVSKIFKTEMDNYLNKNFTKIEIFYPDDASLTQISFYCDKNERTLTLNLGDKFYDTMWGLTKRNPPKTLIRVTNQKYNVCLTSTPRQDEFWGWWCEFGDIHDTEFYSILIGNGGSTKISIQQSIGCRFLARVQHMVCLKTMLEFYSSRN